MLIEIREIILTDPVSGVTKASTLICNFSVEARYVSLKVRVTGSLFDCEHLADQWPPTNKIKRTGTTGLNRETGTSILSASFQLGTI